MATLIWLINIIFGFVEAILGLRFVLKLFGASVTAPFVHWLYAMSEPLLHPFAGAFPSPAIEPGAILEFATLFAILIYALLRYLIIQLIFYIDYRTKRRIVVEDRNR